MANTDYRDGFLVQGASATQGPFSLLGGKYAVSLVATGTGTFGLSILGPDGVTFIPVVAATITTTAGFVVVDLPAGKYQITIATFTNVNASVVPISYHR